MREISRNNIEKIIVIKTYGGLGDLMMATPLITVVKRNFPHAHLSLMISPFAYEVIAGNPFVDEIIPVDPEKEGLKNLISILRKEGFDIAFLLWSKAILAWAIYLSRIPVRVGEAGRLLYSFLYTHKVKRRPYSESDEAHQVEYMLDYARVLGLEIAHDGLVFSIPEEAKRKMSDILADNGIEERASFVVMHIGKGIPLKGKGWPVENFASIADAIMERWKLKVVLTGVSEEKELVDQVESHMKHRPLNLAGITSLKELAALAERCAVFICPDSGPMHIAAAVKAPTIGIFALKKDFPFRWRPYGTRYEIVRKVTECGRDCIKELCDNFVCMQAIKAEDVLPAVARILGEG